MLFDPNNERKLHKPPNNNAFSAYVSIFFLKWPKEDKP